MGTRFHMRTQRRTTRLVMVNPHVWRRLGMRIRFQKGTQKRTTRMDGGGKCYQSYYQSSCGGKCYQSCCGGRWYRSCCGNATNLVVVEDGTDLVVVEDATDLLVVEDATDLVVVEDATDLVVEDASNATNLVLDPKQKQEMQVLLEHNFLLTIYNGQGDNRRFGNWDQGIKKYGQTSILLQACSKLHGWLELLVAGSEQAPAAAGTLLPGPKLHLRPCSRRRPRTSSRHRHRQRTALPPSEAANEVSSVCYVGMTALPNDQSAMQ
ncbi:uncharacterized protein [Miscanthus floridulus]|uniref:uncharacterized protein isoform X1 n=1 Tax=Miscanthus floridulus TaxID=154761 RepID=UPI00345778A9